MKGHSRAARSCLALFLPAFCSSLAAEDTVQIVMLEARQAKTQDGVRLLHNPERLGFSELQRKAVWRLEGVRPGLYDVDLTYSSGNRRKGQRSGSIRVTIGKASCERPIMATGGWGKAGIVSMEKIAIGDDITDLSVCVTQRAEGVHTVLDLWYVDLTPWKPHTIARQRSLHGAEFAYRLARAASAPIDQASSKPTLPSILGARRNAFEYLHITRRARRVASATHWPTLVRPLSWIARVTWHKWVSCPAERSER